MTIVEQMVLFPIKWAMRWVAIRTGSIESRRPTPFMMTLTLFLVFASAFVTDIIGIHSLFGGFIAAFAVPREVAIDIVTKIEDLVTIVSSCMNWKHPRRIADRRA